MDESWWRVLTKRGPLEKGMANRFSVLCLKNPMNSMKKEWRYQFIYELIHFAIQLKLKTIL